MLTGIQRSCSLLSLAIQHLCNWEHEAGMPIPGKVWLWGSLLLYRTKPQTNICRECLWGPRSFSDVWPSFHQQSEPSQLRNLNWAITPGSVGTLDCHGLYEGEQEEDPARWLVRFHPPGQGRVEMGWKGQESHVRLPTGFSDNEPGLVNKRVMAEPEKHVFLCGVLTPACVWPSPLWSSVTSVNITVKIPLPCGCPRKRSFILAWPRAVKEVAATSGRPVWLWYHSTRRERTSGREAELRKTRNSEAGGLVLP